jgi:hypothetical protein
MGEREFFRICRARSLRKLTIQPIGQVSLPLLHLVEHRHRCNHAQPRRVRRSTAVMRTPCPFSPSADAHKCQDQQYWKRTRKRMSSVRHRCLLQVDVGALEPRSLVSDPQVTAKPPHNCLYRVGESMRVEGEREARA